MFLTVGWALPFVFGRSFVDSVLPVRILLPGIVALGLWKITCNDMAGRGHPQYKSYSAGIALLITVLLDIIMIPRLGIAGAALASSVAYTIATLVVVVWFVRASEVRVSDMLIPVLSDFRYIKALLRIRPKIRSEKRMELTGPLQSRRSP